MQQILHKYRFYFIRTCFLLLLFLPFHVVAQEETVVVGQVLNSVDKSPISNVSVYFKNSNAMTQTNEEGYFLIRNSGKQSTLVFSIVGYKSKEFKIKPGQSVGMQVELNERNQVLQEVLVLPGSNPAAELMKKVRASRSRNDLTQKHDFASQRTEQNLVMLNKSRTRLTNKKLFEQLKKGSISGSDSNLVVPLYMAETSYQLVGGNKKELSKNIFSSPQVVEKLVASLIGEVDIELNFYDNSILLFGKSIVSPLAYFGSAYYDFYLADSIPAPTGKQYEVHFRSKNTKNLAFNGTLWVDSTSKAITKIEAELPSKSNINYIHNIYIKQQFKQLGGFLWMRSSEQIDLNMTYEVMADSARPKSNLLVKRSAIYHQNDSIVFDKENFAKSSYNLEALDAKLGEFGKTPYYRTAKWIADAVLTGYMQFGKIDVGKFLELARITDVEGVRLNLPFRTNELLWRNVSVGGAIGYGLKTHLINYSALGQFRLPGEKKRVVGFNYTDDYRRIDYKYNDFMYRENPLVTGDEDISTTMLILWSANKLNRRKECQFSFSNDWNNDIESSLYIRYNRLYANSSLPMISQHETFRVLGVRSATLYTRFSFGEKTYEDHLQRIYITNNQPVLSMTLEGGEFSFGTHRGNYGKIMGAIKHYLRLGFGDLSYVAEAGCILGSVPYPLLETPTGSEAGGYGIYKMNVPVETGSGGYSMYVYNMMKYMEYGADKYLNLHGEFTANGLIMNQIPLIKHLNLRELFSFKMAFGVLNNSHNNQLEFPNFMAGLNKPYVELGVGLTNILHVFSLQSVWRLTDTDKPGVFPWGFRAGLSLSF